MNCPGSPIFAIPVIAAALILPSLSFNAEISWSRTGRPISPNDCTAAARTSGSLSCIASVSGSSASRPNFPSSRMAVILTSWSGSLRASYIRLADDGSLSSPRTLSSAIFFLSPGESDFNMFVAAFWVCGRIEEKIADARGGTSGSYITASNKGFRI